MVFENRGLYILETYEINRQRKFNTLFLIQIFMYNLKINIRKTWADIKTSYIRHQHSFGLAIRILLVEKVFNVIISKKGVHTYIMCIVPPIKCLFLCHFSYIATSIYFLQMGSGNTMIARMRCLWRKYKWNL